MCATYSQERQECAAPVIPGFWDHEQEITHQNRFEDLFSDRKLGKYLFTLYSVSQPKKCHFVAL